MKNEYPTPLEPVRLAEALNTLDIRWMQDPRGSLVAPFRFGDEERLVVTYDVEADGAILAIRGTTSVTYQPDEFPLVLSWLNAWHDEYRWPTASLDVTEPEPSVVGSFQVYLAAGVTESQLTGFVAVGTDTLLQLHRYLAEQHRSALVCPEDLVSADELEQWFRRAA